MLISSRRARVRAPSINHLYSIIWFNYRPSLFIALALTGCSTLLLLFAPFLQPPFPETIIQSIARVFPFARGIFEDKVANFWCTSNVLVKWREREWARSRLPAMALCATLVGILPSTLHVLGISWFSRSGRDRDNQPGSSLQILRSPESFARPLNTSGVPSPAIILLPYALFNSSLAFYMFSFQVHEKSILLPLLPLTLLISARENISALDSGAWEWGVLFNNVATFRCAHSPDSFSRTLAITTPHTADSMWPLLQRDGQQLQYIFLVVFWNYLLGYNPLSTPRSFVKGLSLVRTIIASV